METVERPVEQKLPNILLTGATGYIGGRLLKKLMLDSKHIRCLARDPKRLESRFGEAFEVVQGDLLKQETLQPAFDGVEVAYYLVHSMGGGKKFFENELHCATNFAHAAKQAGVKRIIYLGGICPKDVPLSDHLQSRKQVGEILRERSGAIVIEFRASIIIGAGSLSFDLVRALVEKLPVMITPKWVYVKAQPISIRNVLNYLIQALHVHLKESRIFDIGGADQVSYVDIMREYAAQRRLRRLMIPVPMITPRLSSLWLGLVTPVYARVGRHLVESIRTPTIVENFSAQETFGVSPMKLSEAMQEAIEAEDCEMVETKWSDAVSSSGRRRAYGGIRYGRRIIDCRHVSEPISTTALFAPIEQIGGSNGWYYANWIWKARGLIDLLVGGVGLRRGRRDHRKLYVGDAIDWWRVEAYQAGKRLLLAAEMKVPGRAWLEFYVERDGEDARLTQTAIFDPRGIVGLAYWYLLYPIHRVIFSGMLREIAKRARTDLVMRNQPPISETLEKV